MNLVKIFIDYDSFLANLNNINYDQQYSRQIKNILLGDINTNLSIEILCNEPKIKKYFIDKEMESFFGVYYDGLIMCPKWFKKIEDKQQEIAWKTTSIINYKKIKNTILKSVETILYCDDDIESLDRVRRNVNNLSTCSMSSLVNYIKQLRN